MKKREVFIVILLITFGILYNLYEKGEVEFFFFDECSINPKRLSDKKHSLPFPVDEYRYTDAKSIEIENPAGEIIVKKAEDNTASVRPVIRVYHKDKKHAEGIRGKIKILAEEDNGKIEFKVKPSGKFPYKRVRVEFELQVPENVELKLYNSYGKIDVSGTGKNLSLDNRYGDIKVKDVAAKVNIHTRHGRVMLSNISDEIDLYCQNGTVSIKDAAALKLNTSHSDVSITGIENETDIVHAPYSNIEVVDSSKVRIEGRQTKIRLKNIRNGVHIENSHNSIYMKDISGDINITARNCRIDLDNILSDNLTIKTSQRNVDISDLSAKQLDIAVNNGDLDLKFIRVEEKIIIKNKYSDILLDYPDSVNPLFNINLAYGKIINRTPVEYNIMTDEHRLSVSGTDGTPEIIIDSSYGDIILRQYTPEKIEIKVEPEEFEQPPEEEKDN